MQTFPSMVEPSAASTAAFLAIVGGLCGLLVVAQARAGRARGESLETTHRWTRGTVLLVIVLLAVNGWASGSGVMEAQTLPPPLMFFAFGNLALVTALAFSRFGTRLVQGAPIAGLVGFQGFRLPLELVLHSWYEQGVLPVQMTFQGHNFDIASGVLAIAVGLWLRRGTAPRAAVWVFNVIGTALLVTVATIAITSSPIPLRQYLNDPPVLLGYNHPYGWILPVCVGGALFGHLLVFRWLARPASPH